MGIEQSNYICKTSSANLRTLGITVVQVDRRVSNKDGVQLPCEPKANAKAKTEPTTCMALENPLLSVTRVLLRRKVGVGVLYDLVLDGGIFTCNGHSQIVRFCVGKSKMFKYMLQVLRKTLCFKGECGRFPSSEGEVDGEHHDWIVVQGGGTEAIDFISKGIFG